MGDKPPVSPPKEVRGMDKSSKEDPSVDEVRKATLQKGGKRPTTALGSVIAEALNSSFEGLRDSMNAGFTDLGNLFASHSVGNGDEESGGDCD